MEGAVLLLPAGAHEPDYFFCACCA